MLTLEDIIEHKQIIITIQILKNKIILTQENVSRLSIYVSNDVLTDFMSFKSKRLMKITHFTHFTL